MENSFNRPGLNLPPKTNFQRREGYSNYSSFNQNTNVNTTNTRQFTSLDGRKWQNKDQELRANQDYYRRMMNDTIKKGNYLK